VERLLTTAAASGGPGAASLAEAPRRIDRLAFLEAAVCQDLARVGTLAADAGVDSSALGALTGLAATPLLLACGRHLAGQVAPEWNHGYCPVCGAWPALIEIRGLDRSRRLRCARCGGDWRIDWQRCPFCGETSHERLGALVSETHGDTRKAETCETCRAYVKAVTTLQARPAEGVALEDLTTVELDVAALEQGYARPERPGYALGARLEAPAASAAETRGTRRRFFRWRS
jgi:FdhE protein